MTKAELLLIQEAKNCTFYTIQFLTENNTRTYNENDELSGYVINLQAFDELIKEGVKNGTIMLTENTIEIENTFEL